MASPGDAKNGGAYQRLAGAKPASNRIKQGSIPCGATKLL